MAISRAERIEVTRKKIERENKNVRTIALANEAVRIHNILDLFPNNSS